MKQERSLVIILAASLMVLSSDTLYQWSFSVDDIFQALAVVEAETKVDYVARPRYRDVVQVHR